MRNNPSLLLSSPAQQNVWFTETEKDAEKIRLKEGGVSEDVESSIASPLYKLNNHSNFFYARVIRGDGSCYLSACLVGILGKCVADEERWQIFKNNVARISPKASMLIQQIENLAKSLAKSDDDRRGLDLIKLAQILNVHGDDNPLTQLAKEILIPLHSNLIHKYQKKFAEEVYKENQHNSHEPQYFTEIIHQVSQGNTSFASSYEESLIEPIVQQLTYGMGEAEQFLKVHTFTQEIFQGDIFRNYESASPINPSDICLYNHSGHSHFNLWYHQSDPICKEIEYKISPLEGRHKKAPPPPRSSRLTPYKKPLCDPYFFSYYNQHQTSVVFSTLSIHNQYGKFNYKKWLTQDEITRYNLAEYTEKREQEKIIAMLKQAKALTTQVFTGSNLDNNFFLAVMKVASKNRGIGNINAQNFNDDFTEALQELGVASKPSYLENPNLHQYAKYFSATFQRLSGVNGYLTGRDRRDGSLNQTPRRLFRVCTPENIDKFQSELQRDDHTASASRRLGASPHPSSQRDQGR